MAGSASREAGSTPYPLPGRQDVRGAEHLAARDAIIEVVAAQRGSTFGAILQVCFQIEVVAGT